MLRGLVSAEVIVALGAFATFDDGGRAFRRDLAAKLRADPAHLHSEEVRAIMRELMLSAAWRAAHPGDVERVYRWLDLITPEALAAEADALADLRDLRPELPKLAARLYIRVGAVDAPCPPAISEEICKLVPRARLDVVPDRGHTLLIEDLPATTEAIARELGISEHR